jgi:hypothetical protein
VAAAMLSDQKAAVAFQKRQSEAQAAASIKAPVHTEHVHCAAASMCRTQFRVSTSFSIASEPGPPGISKTSASRTFAIPNGAMKGTARLSGHIILGVLQQL